MDINIAQQFESFVNSEEYQTDHKHLMNQRLFESFVNSEEYQTGVIMITQLLVFESFVNSEEYQTHLKKYLCV